MTRNSLHCVALRPVGLVNLPQRTSTMDDTLLSGHTTSLDSDSPARDAVERACPGKKLRVMVVDDNRDVADLFGMFFDFLGHDVSVRYEARSALANVSEHAPHLFFIDIGMPQIDGYGLVRQLKCLPELASSTFVAFSGFCGPDTQCQALEAGFHRHLTKPCSLEIIAEVVEEHIAAMR